MTQKQLQLALQNAITQEQIALIRDAIQCGANQNALLPCGVLPMVHAVNCRSVASYVELRRLEISEEQWRAASDAAAGTDFAAMVSNRQEMVPKPLATFVNSRLRPSAQDKSVPH